MIKLVFSKNRFVKAYFNNIKISFEIVFNNIKISFEIVFSEYPPLPKQSKSVIR